MDALDSVTSEPSPQQTPTISDLLTKIATLQTHVSRLAESNDILVSYLRHNLTIGLLREPND